MFRALFVNVIAALLVASAAFAVPAERLVICDFENEADIARFQIRASTPPSALALTTQHVTQGTRAALLTIPKWQQGSEEWPAMILGSAKGLPTDWTAYDFVAADVFNASAREVDLGFFLGEGLGQHAGQHFLVPQGQSRTLRFDLQTVPKAFDLSRVKEFHIYATRPPQAVSVIVDCIRLEGDTSARLAKIGSRISSLKKDSKAYAAQMAQLWKEVDASYAGLTERASHAADASALRMLRPDILTLDKRLQTGVPRAVSEARMQKASKALHPSLPYACGFASSMEKILPRDVAFQCNVTRECKVELAGNEVESLQLLIYAFAHDLKATRIEVGPLKPMRGKAGRLSPRAEASPVGFVQTTKPAYPVSYIGWYPDPILDFLKTFDVREGEVQPVWIRVKTPPGTPAGDYRGEIIVRPANAAALRLGLRVHVFGFDLPKQTHIRTAMSLYDQFLPNAYGTRAASLRAKYEDFILSYRINPDNIYRSTPPAIADLQRWDRQGLNAFNIVYVQKPKDLKAGDPYPAEWKRSILDKLDAIVPQLKATGLYGKAYVYGFDEIGPESYAAMSDIFSAIKAKYPDLPIMTTGRDHTYGETSGIDTVDAWCPLTPYYDLDRVTKARARGKQVWWYICCVPHAPFANWFIESDGIDARVLMGLQTAKYQPDGFLYYAMMRWPLTKKPITGGPYTDWPAASIPGANGDGSIICAGPDGPVPTIRLENIRDGIEDYEYFWVLQNEVNRLKTVSGPNAIRALKQAGNALTIGEELVANLSSFTKSPRLLLAKRRQVAEAIISARKVN